MSAISQELALLLHQQDCHYGELQDLEEKLRQKRLAYIQLGDEISALIAQESAARPPSGAEAPPARSTSESGGGFRLTALTPRGVSMLDALDRVLARLPHSGSL